ncbi:MAG: hypothetical protein EOO54_10125 [Haliea sp.]|nr:MAG: hypothetical protein EOO54_10125 [Haliea sp.]
MPRGSAEHTGAAEADDKVDAALAAALAAAKREAGKAASAKAIASWRMANTLCKALAKRTSYRWQFFDFLGPNRRESAGIVDIVAMRKSGKAPGSGPLKRYDLFELVLIQVKGGAARWPTAQEIDRLKEVARVYNATAVVLFEWKLKTHSRYLVLDEQTSEWVETRASKLFGA